MLGRWKRQWRWTRPSTGKTRLLFRRKGQILLSLLLGLSLAVALIVTLELRLHPILEAVATAEVSNLVSNQFNQQISAYLAEQDLQYGDFVTMEKGNEGQITALTSNMSALNQLRTTALAMALATAQETDRIQLTIPLGNLFGLNFLSGKGVVLSVDVVTAGTGEATFTHLFEEAGVNQTRHQILLLVTVTVEILLPGGTITQDVSAELPVAETIIVGQVPQTYLQLP